MKVFSVGLSGIEFRSSGRSLARHDVISCDNMVMMYVVLKLINLYPIDVIFVRIITTETSRIVHYSFFTEFIQLNLTQFKNTGSTQCK